MLQWFTGENLRCIEKVELKELGALNILVGRNGAGKTSVLEGMHVLGRGRSFRTARLSELQRRGTEFLRAVGGVSGERGTSVIGVERRGGLTELRVAAQRVERASDLAKQLPLLVIRPESHELVSGSSDARRRVLDWVMFHVEHTYGVEHARYRRVLQQRNALLKQQPPLRVLQAFDPEFHSAAEALHNFRSNFFSNYGAALTERIETLVGFPVAVEYRRGWPQDLELSEALAESIERDRSQGFTSRGPHRADLALSTETGRARSVLSRGEAKLTVLGLLLALADTLNSIGVAPVLLVDDLASELDGYSRERFFKAVSRTGCQTFVSTVDSDLIPEPWRTDARVFHVEQGHVQPMI